jgi:hypothetical protein
MSSRARGTAPQLQCARWPQKAFVSEPLEFGLQSPSAATAVTRCNNSQTSAQQPKLFVTLRRFAAWQSVAADAIQCEQRAFIVRLTKNLKISNRFRVLKVETLAQVRHLKA